MTPPVDACGPPENVGAFCDLAYRLTHNADVARISNIVVARPAKILLIVVIAWITSRVFRRSIRRFTKGLGAVSSDVLGGDRSSGALMRTMPRATARARQRGDTVGALLGSLVSIIVWTIAAIMVLGELGLDLGPLIAGAGIVGVALGFGAQHLVRDFLSGVFMLIEDQFGVGDVIDAGPASGTVEGVSLRTTRLRDVEGNVWHIPNGYIDRVANKSQEWSRALLDIRVSYDNDIHRATEVITEAAVATWQDPAWSAEILEEPELWGVEDLGPDGVTVRLVVKTRPLSQWRVARELRARIKRAFDDAGIEIPASARVVWQQADGPVGAATGAGPEDR